MTVHLYSCGHREIESPSMDSVKQENHKHPCPACKKQMNDNRAIVHTAGRYNGLEQKCTRCQSVIYQRSWDGNGWKEGASVANHGNGGWSVVHAIEFLDVREYRPCATRGKVAA